MYVKVEMKSSNRSTFCFVRLNHFSVFQKDQKNGGIIGDFSQKMHCFYHDMTSCSNSLDFIIFGFSDQFYMEIMVSAKRKILCYTMAEMHRKCIRELETRIENANHLISQNETHYYNLYFHGNIDFSRV